MTSTISIYLAVALIMAIVWTMNSGHPLYEMLIDVLAETRSGRGSLAVTYLAERLSCCLMVGLVAVAYGALWAITLTGRLITQVSVVFDNVDHTYDTLKGNVRRWKRREERRQDREDAGWQPNYMAL